MNQFSNVTVVKKGNIFFGGGVTSRTIIFPDGSRKTLGFAQPGEYEFTTAVAEIMEILAGEADVQVGDGPWHRICPGESFEVPPQTRFIMKSATLVDYCCSFLP